MHENVYNVSITQNRAIRDGRSLSLELIGALHRAINSVIYNPQMEPRDRIYVSMHSNRLNNAYEHRGATVNEWRTSSLLAKGILDQIASILNSNENFEVNDSFSFDVVHVRSSHRGSGKIIPGSRSIHTLRNVKKKQSFNYQEKAEECVSRGL